MTDDYEIKCFNNIEVRKLRMISENLIYSNLENEKRSAKSIFDEVQAHGISIRTLKSVKSAMRVHSIKKDGNWCWELNNEEVDGNAKQ